MAIRKFHFGSHSTDQYFNFHGWHIQKWVKLDFAELPRSVNVWILTKNSFMLCFDERFLQCSKGVVLLFLVHFQIVLEWNFGWKNVNSQSFFNVKISSLFSKLSRHFSKYEKLSWLVVVLPVRFSRKYSVFVQSESLAFSSTQFTPIYFFPSS